MKLKLMEIEVRGKLKGLNTLELFLNLFYKNIENLKKHKNLDLNFKFYFGFNLLTFTTQRAIFEAQKNFFVIFPQEKNFSSCRNKNFSTSKCRNFLLFFFELMKVFVVIERKIASLIYF